MTLLMSSRDRALCDEAIYTAINTLITRAMSRGRAWSHYSNGELVIGTRLTISGH
jgi:hypothetical protein